MHSLNRFYTVLGIFLTVCTCTQAQSPWIRSKAGMYAQASWQFIPAYETLFGPNGEDQALERTVSEGTFQLYGEYGLGRKSTIIVSLPYRVVRAGEAAGAATPQTTQGSLSGLGNVSISLRHTLLNKRMPLTASLRVDAPTGRYRNASGLRTAYDAITVLPMLSTGIGFNRAYVFAYGGYGIRTNNYSHFLDAGIEGGYKIGAFWLIGFSEWVHPIDNGAVKLPDNNLLTGLFVNNQGYLSIGLKGIWQFNRFIGLVVTGAGALQAENVPKSPGIGLGCFFKWE
jgi:hypothetical protein